MKEVKNRAILLYNKISSENNLYLKFLTENDEILTGVSFGGSSKKKKSIYQLGYFLNLNIKFKNSNFPKNITGELTKPFFYNIFNNKYKLHCLLSIVSLLNLSIIEGQKIPGIFSNTEKIIKLISDQENWIVDYFLYLLNMLKLIGYEIDFVKHKSFRYLNLDTLQFNENNSRNSIIFPHDLLNKKIKINLENVTSFFRIFEIILQNHHLNNMNLNIPNSYLKFKKLILEFLSK